MRIDPRIIKACRNQEQGGQKQLYQLLLPYLRAVAMRYLKDDSYVKDVLQESFVKIFLNIDKYDSEKARIEKWAARITINSCLNYNQRVIGKVKAELSVKFKQLQFSPMIMQSLSQEDLLKFLKSMPKEFFNVFNLQVIDGYTHKEISNLLGISEALSRQRLSRARVWLKKNALKPSYEE